MRKLPAQALFAVALAAISASASAHCPGRQGFCDGFVHPLLGFDHWAAMLAIGLWGAASARRAGPALLCAPLGFAALLLVGAVLGWQGLRSAAVEPMIAASLLVIGLLLAARLRLPGLLAALGAGAFALFHGLAHAQELSAGGKAWQILAGMLAATALLHGAGLALGWALRRRALWPTRAAGLSLAAWGAALLLPIA